MKRSVQRRRDSAAERKQAREKRTAQQQIARLDAGGYRAERERTRLGGHVLAAAPPPGMKEDAPHDAT